MLRAVLCCAVLCCAVLCQLQPLAVCLLSACRADVAVRDSRGRRRHDSVGAATRARFHSLPGVGQKTAKLWWDLGCRWVAWGGGGAAHLRTLLGCPAPACAASAGFWCQECLAVGCTINLSSIPSSWWPSWLPVSAGALRMLSWRWNRAARWRQLARGAHSP